jgi:ribosome biogenesis GTPase A
VPRAGAIPDTAIDYLTIGMFGARFLLERYPALVVARYKLPAPPSAPEALLAEIGRRRGGLRKGGTVDLHKAAEVLVHEFRAGVMGPISLETPPSDRATTGDAVQGRRDGTSAEPIASVSPVPPGSRSLVRS